MNRRCTNFTQITLGLKRLSQAKHLLLHSVFRFLCVSFSTPPTDSQGHKTASRPRSMPKSLPELPSAARSTA